MALTIDEALALCFVAGFDEKDLVRAVAIMTAESGRTADAIGINPSPPSIDRGAFQINSIHADLSNFDSLCPLPNARKAKEILDASGWTAWTTFDSGAYIPFKEEIRARFDAGAWRALTPYMECF